MLNRFYRPNVKLFGVQNADGIHGDPSYRPLSATACVYCSAEPGVFCTMPDGSRRSKVHSVRIDYWEGGKSAGEWVAELLAGNPELDLHEGDLVLVQGSYEKDRLEILRRITDGHDPEASAPPRILRFVRESTAAERKLTERRVLSQSTIEDREAIRLYQRGLGRHLAAMV